MRVSNWARIVGALLAVVFVVGCGGEDNPTPPAGGTGVQGTVTVVPGSPADPTNARAAVYSSLADFANDAWVKQSAVARSGSVWTFTIDQLTPGTYYVDVWKDINNDGFVNVGDIYGYYTTGTLGQPAPVVVAASQLTPITMLVVLNTVPSKGMQ